MNTVRLFDQAHQARLSSQFKKAQNLYKRLLKNLFDPFEKAEAALGLADVQRIQGDFRASLHHYEMASNCLKGKDPMGVMDAKVGWALAARAVGRPIEALTKLKAALSFYKKEKDPQGEAFVHWALGGTYRIAGDMRRGLAELQVALRIYKKLKEEEGIAYTCCALGGVYRMLGRYAESGKWYREANRRMWERKDTFGTAYSYCGLGNVERMAGRFKQALPFYRKAEKLYGTIGDKVSYAYTLWSIGTAEKMLRRFSLARKAFLSADRLFVITGDTRGRIYTLLGFAEVNWMEGKLAKGFQFWGKAKSIADKSSFAWEKLHVESLKDGRVNMLETKYKKTGSHFHPEIFPVNWP